MLEAIFTAFLLGLATPLGAVCVIPLYPAFISYLAKKLTGNKKNDKKIMLLFGLLITAGAITFMALIGLLFTTILQVSLTSVIGILSPIAYGILVVISLFLIFDVDIGKFLPQTHTPRVKSPLWSAYLYGLFFGGIVIPCNPLFISALFGLAAGTLGWTNNMLQFLSFGLGMGAPLILFSVLSATKSQVIINWITKHRTWINRISGIIMLVLSLYLLIFDFQIFSRIFG